MKGGGGARDCRCVREARKVVDLGTWELGYMAGIRWRCDGGCGGGGGGWVSSHFNFNSCRCGLRGRRRVCVVFLVCLRRRLPAGGGQFARQRGLTGGLRKAKKRGSVESFRSALGRSRAGSPKRRGTIRRHVTGETWSSTVSRVGAPWLRSRCAQHGACHAGHAGGSLAGVRMKAGGGGEKASEWARCTARRVPRRARGGDAPSEARRPNGRTETRSAVMDFGHFPNCVR